ncbi:MAG: hypothetical protein P1V36_04855 [Planctomycetota bacterium]|nr:hypothetical protein [Planctomycetota bacterium]
MIERAFARAFNARNIGALVTLLAPDARSELAGSGFPPEEGAGAIRGGSFEHLLEDEGLTAAPLEHDGTSYVAFHAEDGSLDSLAALTAIDGVITQLRYHTRWHDEAFVDAIADATA